MAYTTIDNPELYFQVKLFTGNGSTQSLTLDGDEDMQPDLLWFKQRDGTGNHAVFDAVRGTTGSVYRRLITEGTEAEDTAANTLTAIGSDGFTVGSDGNINGSSETMVAWCWKANGTGSANTEGNTDTTISANTTAGFSIIDGCDDLNDDDTFGHGLNSAPNLVIMKRLDDVSGWRVFYTGITDGSTLSLNSTAAVGDDGATVGPVSSTLITVEGSGTGGNEGDNENVAYAWHSVQGYSKIGTYSGNNNADGTFVWTGFRPAFVMCKITGGVDNWIIMDSKRLGYNGANYQLIPNSSLADQNPVRADLLSNGFKAKSTNAEVNNGSYVYMAFAEAPFVNSNGVPCNAR